jgi:hypothetical protein
VRGGGLLLGDLVIHWTWQCKPRSDAAGRHALGGRVDAQLRDQQRGQRLSPARRRLGCLLVLVGNGCALTGCSSGPAI